MTSPAQQLVAESNAELVAAELNLQEVIDHIAAIEQTMGGAEQRLRKAMMTLKAGHERVRRCEARLRSANAALSAA